MSIGRFSGIFIVLFETSEFRISIKLNWIWVDISTKMILQLHANQTVKCESPIHLSNNIWEIDIWFGNHQRIKLLSNEVLQLIDCGQLSCIIHFVITPQHLKAVRDREALLGQQPAVAVNRWLVMLLSCDLARWEVRRDQMRSVMMDLTHYTASDYVRTWR